MRGLLQTLFGAIVMVADEVSLREALASLRPEIVVVDLDLEHGNGIRLLMRLHADFPATRIVSIGGQDLPAIKRAALAAGASAFVAKPRLAEDLVAAVEVARGVSH